MELKSKNLNFSIKDNKVFWSSDTAILKSTQNSDLFRMHLDDDMNKELTVFGKDQTIAKVETMADGLDIYYNKIVAEDNREFDIEYIVHIRKSGDGFDFTSTVKNNSDVRINEIQVPFIELNTIADDAKENDTLYMPMGLGQRIENPWETIQKTCHTEYFAADYNEIWYYISYPFPASMGWYGVESDGYFFYVGRHDTGFKTCALGIGTGERREKNNRLCFTISNYPVATKGETITTGVTHVALLDGTWAKGSEVYSTWANSTWFVPTNKPLWVRELTGWQRIILKHQYGETYFKYKDLVDLYKQGEKYGIKMLLVFGWWKGRFDNGYPIYEIDPEMGGEEELLKAIDEIHKMGGKVVLYAQGVLLDVNTDYYKEVGHKIARKNIEGVPYQEQYQFSNNGSMLKLFGYKTFASACQATDEWKNKLLEVGKMVLSLNSDSLFFDQVAGHIPKLCFDTTHKHKNRVDDESVYRQENLKDMLDLCSGDVAFGSENTVDAFCPELHFHHGHMTGAWYSKDAFPQLFKTTFPDEIISNRLLHDAREDYVVQLNYAFTYGLIFDISIYRGRKVALGEFPQYGEYVKKILDLKEQYKDFFYHGQMVNGYELTLPEGIISQAFKNNSGEIMYTVWNNTDEAKTIEILNQKITLKSQDITCVK